MLKNASGLKIDFEKLRFHKGFVWMVGMTVVTNIAAFSNSFKFLMRIVDVPYMNGLF